MGESLFVKCQKTYTINDFGIVLKDKIIPVGSIADISFYGLNSIQINWNLPDSTKIKTIVNSEELEKLINNNIMVDIKKVRTPETEPIFKKGDLIRICYCQKENCTCYIDTDPDGDNWEEEAIIESAHYDFKLKEWYYKLFKLDDDFSKGSIHDDIYFYEESLVPIKEVKSIIKFAGRDFSVIVSEV